MELFTIPVLAAISFLSGIKSVCGICLWKKNEYEDRILWREKKLYGYSALWLILYSLIWLAAGKSMNTVRLADLCITYVMLALIDGKRRIVPDSVLLCFLAEQMLMGAMVMRAEMILKIFITGLLFTVTATAFAWVTKEQIGMGDIRLLGVTAMTAGWGFVIQILFYAMVLSFGYSLILVLYKKKSVKAEFPFVPFLAAGLATHMILLAC
ncbi:MAG: prepilin peptidase [Brotaphodocola sp.]